MLALNKNTLTISTFVKNNSSGRHDLSKIAVNFVVPVELVKGWGLIIPSSCGSMKKDVSSIAQYNSISNLRRKPATNL